jgi:hypothetical protein
VDEPSGLIISAKTEGLKTGCKLRKKTVKKSKRKGEDKIFSIVYEDRQKQKTA